MFEALVVCGSGRTKGGGQGVSIFSVTHYYVVKTFASCIPSLVFLCLCSVCRCLRLSRDCHETEHGTKNKKCSPALVYISCGFFFHVSGCPSLPSCRPRAWSCGRWQRQECVANSPGRQTGTESSRWDGRPMDGNERRYRDSECFTEGLVT